MGRKAHASYEQIGLEILTSLGGGPISTKTFVAAVGEHGALSDSKWAYHNFTRKIRESALFDTSVRGQVSLTTMPNAQQVENAVAVADAVASSILEDTEIDGGFKDEPVAVGAGE